VEHWLHDTWQHLQLGEALVAGGVDSLLRGWQAPAADMIGKLCTGAERWQAAIREIQATVSLADILRARTLV
jgi:hypothetical protein